MMRYSQLQFQFLLILTVKTLFMTMMKVVLVLNAQRQLTAASLSQKLKPETSNKTVVCSCPRKLPGRQGGPSAVFILHSI